MKTLLVLTLMTLGFASKAADGDSSKYKLDLFAGPAFSTYNDNWDDIPPRFAAFVHADLTTRGNWSFYPGLGYENFGSRRLFNYTDASGNSMGVFKESVNLHYATLLARMKYIFRYELNWDFYYHAGPFFSYLIDAKRSADKSGPSYVNKNISGDFKRHNAGLGFGLGFHRNFKNASRFTIELRANIGFVKIKEKDPTYLFNIPERSTMIQVLFGYGIPIYR